MNLIDMYLILKIVLNFILSLIHYNSYYYTLTFVIKFALRNMKELIIQLFNIP